MLRKDFNLRPIEERDLELILSWRNSERVRACMYTDHVITLEEHWKWFKRVSQAEFSTVLVFEYQGVPAGLKNFSQIDRNNNRCYWGFYMGEAHVPRGCGTVMGFLALEYILEQQNFRKLCAEVFAFNFESVKYHTRLGFVQEGFFVNHVIKNGEYLDIKSFAIFRDDWLKSKHLLQTKIFQPRDAV